jgi:serine/threonine protein kinase
MIGKSILNYEIKSLIGLGGMGSVYLAEHTQVSRKVAIKSLLPQFISNDEIRLRFKNEASTLAHLQHPNIVGLFDYLEDSSGMFLIMEYVEGTPLDEFIANVTGPMPEERAIPIIKEILSAFSYAHQKGIIHRDIKPANIIITKNDGAKILDFGIARILGDGNHNLTKTGTQMGTVFYMSPEQVQGKKLDIRSDIYSLGVTFYQMLTGINPYNGLTTEYEVYSKIVKEDLPPLQDIYPGVPDYLSSIISKALEKDPDNRFQTCEEFLDAITVKEQLPKQEFKSTEAARPMPPVESAPKNGLANASIVLAGIGILTSFIPYVNFISIVLTILAILFGFKALKKISENSNLKKSKGIANAGVIVGIIGLLIGLITSISLLFFVILLDSDSDGFIDSKDECVYEKGTLNGCPDTDHDGVKDYEDNCIESAGTKEHNGCPDSDGDGVFDSEDECIEEAGSPENSGCPKVDSDEDGVPDDMDYCPEIFGTLDDGCPVEEEVTYRTVCPSCLFESYENTNNRLWTCGNCSKEFYNCVKNDGKEGGIPKNWVGDGTCDCNDCSDEN